MFWLYFAREFYRLQNQATPAPVAAHAPAVAEEPKSQPTPSIAPVAQPQPQLHSAEQPVASFNTWLQRLSVEGDHAFGVWDSESGFSMFSANFDRVTGLSSGECAGHDWIHTIHNDQQYSINEALLNAEKGLDSRCLVQVCSLHAEESWRWMLVDVKAATPRQPHIMVLWRDLTEQKALEETLKQMETSLAMSERGRSAFLSSMSHELRTPLNAIMGFSEMMKSGVFGPLENPTYAQYAEHIHDSGSMLLAKINDLLDIASMDAGGMEIEETEFMLPDLLAEVIEIHSHQAFTRNQRLHLDCPLKLMVMADRAKLLCATSHLISNALRHSQNDDEITIAVRVQADDGVIISVRDGGEGISPAQLDIIRKAMEADVAYFNIECGGVGLGLSLVKELAARHGGRVMIDSIRHRGTVASIILPITRVMRGLPAKKKARHS